MCAHFAISYEGHRHTSLICILITTDSGGEVPYQAVLVGGCAEYVLGHISGKFATGLDCNSEDQEQYRLRV